MVDADNTVTSSGASSSRKGKNMKWAETIQKKIANLGQSDVLNVNNFSSMAKICDKKCTAELKKLKGPVRASKLLMVTTSILRSLKLFSREFSGEETVTKAMLGRILGHTISFANRSKESRSEPQALAESVYGFIKVVLDGNADWIFLTILASVITEIQPVRNSFAHYFLRLLMTDPFMVSPDIDVKSKATAATSFLLKYEDSRQPDRLIVAPTWMLVEANFINRSRNCNPTIIIQSSRNQLSKCFQKGKRSLQTDSINEVVEGVHWSISTAPSDVPALDLVDIDQDSEGPSLKRPRILESEECEDVSEIKVPDVE